MLTETHRVVPAVPIQAGIFSLSTWDQIFPCLYTPRFQCFPFTEEADLNPILTILRSALPLALSEWPDLCGVIVDEDEKRGSCSLKLDPQSSVELRICHQRSDNLDSRSLRKGPLSFSRLAEQGFPPALLSHPDLANFDRDVQRRP